MPQPPKPKVIIGVVPAQSDAVLLMAAEFARRFDADLVCAFVDPGRYVVDEGRGGTITSLPLDPDLPDLREEVFDPELRSHLADVLGGQDVPWSTRALAGDPAIALGRLAEELDAAMIVVGTRTPTIRGTMREFLNGSVAARLAHRQHRPVVVIPLDPVEADGSLPWGRE